ncbi:MAG: NAD(P)-dependent oxidoreductase [Rhizobiales bacterium 65-79]|jgi:nucleoside-diphosphate-sugar epimerase|nr:SDR family oxidoreductase [Hyphomicrobiales bacterium]OJU06976.1 MAG: NAD(P)-dependent oxidoreductase [Rhizobiales bacterium 65-79]
MAGRARREVFGVTTRIFLLGAGYSARAFAALQRDRDDAIFGTTRSAEKLDALRKDGIEPLLFDGDTINADMAEALRKTTHLVLSAAPETGALSAGGDPFLPHIEDRLRHLMPELRWIGYLSTVGVYGDHGGAWVDEESECRPVSRRSIARLAAERAWQALAEKERLPLAILRLAGIYGPGRNALVNLAAGTARRIVKHGQVFNRIHVDDIAGALSLLAEREAGGIFNLADNAPSPPQDVIAFAARLMGVEPPPETPFDAAEMTPMARSFYGENKRVSNARLRDAGYSLIHPDYSSALTRMWRENSWR